MKTETTQIGNEVVEHKDAAYSNVAIVLTFWDAVKALFKRKINVHTSIYTMNDELLIVKTNVHVYVDDFFPRKRQGFAEVSTPKTETMNELIDYAEKNP